LNAIGEIRDLGNPVVRGFLKGTSEKAAAVARFQSTFRL
jgi:hypothetical protein